MEVVDYKDDKVQIKKDGKVVDCDVLFTFDSEDTMKVYVGYTDHSVAANGRKNIYVSSYDPFTAETKLEDVTDPREMEMVHDVLQQIDKEANS